MPLSSTKAPKAVIFLTLPLTRDPTGIVFSMLSMVIPGCLTPSVIFLLSCAACRTCWPPPPTSSRVTAGAPVRVGSRARPTTPSSEIGTSRGLPAHHRRDGIEAARGAPGCPNEMALWTVAKLLRLHAMLRAVERRGARQAADGCVHALREEAGGCRRYQHRPTECRQFYCGYLLDPALDERWKPSRSKLVVAFDEYMPSPSMSTGHRPTSGARSPSTPRSAAGRCGRHAQVVVWQGDTKSVVSPEPYSAARAGSS